MQFANTVITQGKTMAGSFSSQTSRLSVKLAILVLVSVYVLINLFRIGGDNFVIALNNNIGNPLAIAVTVLAFMRRRELAVGGQNRMMWTGLAAGWALWTVAEVWWGIAALAGRELPFPSWADLFWLAGYVPMTVALWVRARSLPGKLSPYQRVGIGFSILLSIGATFWLVLFPIYQTSGPASRLENVLNILYPVADLILLIPVLFILFAYRQSVYGRAWTWLSTGFVLHSLSNLVFSYATTMDLFYPDGQANLISTMGTDVPYNISYLMWLIGLVILRGVSGKYNATEPWEVSLKPPPDTHVLVFTKADDIVIDASLNYSFVFPGEFIKGQSLAPALRIMPEEAGALVEALRTAPVLPEREVLADTLFGPCRVGVSGISISSAEGQYSGVSLLLRLVTHDPTLDQKLSENQKSMVQYLLRKTGTGEKAEEEKKQLLTAYFSAYLAAFYNRVWAEGGSVMAEAFLDELQSLARARNWPVQFQAKEFLDTGLLSLAETRTALPALCAAARGFVAGITDPGTADRIVQAVRANFDEAALQSVAYFGGGEDFSDCFP